MNDTSGIRLTWAQRLPLFRHKCPHCDSVKFKAAELRPFDGLLGLVGLHPVRCMFCWRRFYWVALSGAPAE